MARKPRAHVFMFDPDLFKSDPVVRRMTLAALGAYLNLLIECWRSHDPGIIEGDDETVRRLAGADSTEWPTIRPQVAPAFDTSSKPGTWVQKRVRQTYLAQQRRYRAFKVAGKSGSKKRWEAARQLNADKEEEWPGYSLAMARPLARVGSRLDSKEVPLGNVVTVPDSKPLGNGAKSVRLADATHRGKDPKTEAQAVTLDAAMVSANVGPETRSIVVAHYRSNANTISNPLAYYRVGSQDFWTIAADLSAKAEVQHHRTEEPRS